MKDDASVRLQAKWQDAHLRHLFERLVKAIERIADTLGKTRGRTNA